MKEKKKKRGEKDNKVEITKWVSGLAFHCYKREKENVIIIGFSGSRRANWVIVYEERERHE